MGARIFTASRNACAAATAAHTNPASGVGTLAWRGAAWMLTASVVCPLLGRVPDGPFLAGKCTCPVTLPDLSKARVDTPVRLQS